MNEDVPPGPELVQGVGFRAERRQFAKEAADHHVASRIAVLRTISANTTGDAELTKRVVCGFADSTEIAAEHFRGCGYAPAQASATAAALIAAVEGAIDRLPGTQAGFIRGFGGCECPEMAFPDRE